MPHSENSKVANIAVPSRKLVHIEKIPMRWGDMDAYSHVNNASYFRYFEQARVGWMEAAGQPMGTQGVGFVVVTSSCNFRRPLVYPGTLEIRVYCGEAGRSSVPSYYEIRLDNDHETVYAQGEAVIVWVTRETGKPCPIPEVLRKQL